MLNDRVCVAFSLIVSLFCFDLILFLFRFVFNWVVLLYRILQECNRYDDMMSVTHYWSCCCIVIFNAEAMCRCWSYCTYCSATIVPVHSTEVKYKISSLLKLRYVVATVIILTSCKHVVMFVCDVCH